MICGAKVWLCVVGMLSCAFTAPALTAENPYHTIVDRNPFGLNPPAPPATNDVVVPLKNIKFNGITYTGGRKKAFFTIPGKEAKDPPQYVTLAEDERADVLEVTRILKEEGEVEVINSGVKMTLTFKNNGNAFAPSAAVASAAPIAAPVPVPMASSPVASPVYTQPQLGSAVQNSSAPVMYAANPPQGVVFNPALGSSTIARGSVAQANSSPHPAGSPLSAADQQILMRQNHDEIAYRFQTGQYDTVNYAPGQAKNPVIYSPTPATGPRRMLIPPPPPLPGQ